MEQKPLTLFEILVSQVLLTEGIYDPGIFKAVFLAGGSGSGKGFMSANIGLTIQSALTYDDIEGREIKQKITTTGAAGLKVVNIDDVSNYVNLKAGLGTVMGDTIAMNYDMLAHEDPEKFAQSQANREVARGIHKSRMELYRGQGLGLLIDQTSSDPSKVWLTKASLEDSGYDCYMVWVATPREVAWAKNQSRGEHGTQVVSRETFDTIWDEVDGLSDFYERMFGYDRFLRVSNSGQGVDFSAVTAVYNQIQKWLMEPPSNEDVRAWMEWMLGEE